MRKDASPAGSPATTSPDLRDEPFGRGPADARVLDIREILRIASARWRLIVATTLAGLLLGLLIALITTPRYRTTALLAYDPNATESLDQTAARPTFKAYQANQELMATQLGLLGSESIARRVAQDLNLANNPTYGGKGSFDERLDRASDVVRSGISAEAVKNSLLIRVTFTSTDPQMAARVVNAVSRAFIATSLERRYNSSSYARKFLNDQLASTRKALEASERVVNDYAIRTNLFRAPGVVVDGHVTEGRTLSDTDLSALADALNQARVKRIAAETASLNKAGPQTEGPLPTSALAQQRATLQAEYAENGKLFKPAYPQMRQLKAQIDRLGVLIDADRRQQADGQTRQLNAAYLAARQEEDKLAARVTAAKQQVQGERTSSIQYNILQREVDTNRTLYNALLQRFKEVGVAGGITQSNLSLVDTAEVPKYPYRPNIAINATAGLIVGLLAGFGAALVVHLLLDTVIDGADVREKLRQRVLGIIPREQQGIDLNDSLADRRSEITEAYYSTLTAIRSRWADTASRVLFVTSSRPGEGKSTSSYAIAAISARLGSRVLLIDADLRRPTLTTAGPIEPGLAHLLARGGEAADLIRSTGIDNLSILPVGSFTESPAELLSSVRLRAIVEDLRHDFDLVVLDGPPVLGLTDAPLLGAVADSTILVIESGQTRTASVHDMMRRLRDVGADVLGVVLTKASKGSAGYGYAYDYYSYPAASSSTRFDPGRSLQLDRRDA